MDVENEGILEELTQRARQALVGFARDHVVAAGAMEDRERLEQSLCFAGAVWNAVVLMEALEDPEALADIAQRIDEVPSPHRDHLRAAMWALCERKLQDHRGQHWVYRHLHVVRGKGSELFVRCEALTLSAWLASGEPLRMGLVE